MNTDLKAAASCRLPVASREHELISLAKNKSSQRNDFFRWIMFLNSFREKLSGRQPATGNWQLLS